MGTFIWMSAVRRRRSSHARTLPFIDYRSTDGTPFAVSDQRCSTHIMNSGVTAATINGQVGLRGRRWSPNAWEFLRARGARTRNLVIAQTHSQTSPAMPSIHASRPSHPVRKTAASECRNGLRARTLFSTTLWTSINRYNNCSYMS